MKSASKSRCRFSAKKLAFSALFSALVCVASTIIVIPLPNGYFNTGDVFVLLSGWFLGPLFGAISAGVGSMLADIISGFAIYAPATFFVKAFVAIVAYQIWFVCKKLIKKQALDFLPRIVSAILAESVMVLGYFLFESYLYGFAGGALALLGNSLQGALCMVLAVCLCSFLTPIKAVQKLFPSLT